MGSTARFVAKQRSSSELSPAARAWHAVRCGLPPSRLPQHPMDITTCLASSNTQATRSDRDERGGTRCRRIRQVARHGPFESELRAATRIAARARSVGRRQFFVSIAFGVIEAKYPTRGSSTASSASRLASDDGVEHLEHRQVKSRPVDRHALPRALSILKHDRRAGVGRCAWATSAVLGSSKLIGPAVESGTPPTNRPRPSSWSQSCCVRNHDVAARVDDDHGGRVGLLPSRRSSGPLSPTHASATTPAVAAATWDSRSPRLSRRSAISNMGSAWVAR